MNDLQDEVFHDSKCPHCACTLSFPGSCAGTPQECPQCGGIVIVPRDPATVAGLLPVPARTDRLILRLPAVADVNDLAACRMLEKAGMRREGEFRQERMVKGVWTDTLCFALLQEEPEREI